jgi:hypothetical protein
MYTPIVWKEGFLLQTRFHLIPLGLGSRFAYHFSDYIRLELASYAVLA